MSDAIYSKAIFDGMKARGWSRQEILSISGLAEGELTAVLDGKHSFSDDVIVRIERSTGLTGGQLAVSSFKDAPDSLVQLMNEWAKIRNTTPSRQPTVSN